MKSLSIVFILLFALSKMCKSCYLWGANTGECLKEAKDGLWRERFMPFCRKAVRYSACVPVYQTLPPSREFPEGRWFNHTIVQKDTWVHDTSREFIRMRMDLERNKTLRGKRENEFGDKGRIRRRFYKKPDCKNAFRNLFCWLNFPRCDYKSDLTYPTCRSACENFFISCGYEQGLWRCGKSKYFNGYDRESPTKVKGNITYLREYMPGQPFRENKFHTGGHEKAICTPAIDGSASRGPKQLASLLAWICTIFLLICFLSSPPTHQYFG